MRLPWSKNDECEHVVKYHGTNIEIAGITIPNIFSLGSVKINPQVLQAAEKAIQYLDLAHFENCKTLKLAPDDERKKKFFDEMSEQQKKLNSIGMAIAAYSTNPNSQKLEESLAEILKSNLALPDSNKTEINNLINLSMKNIKSKRNVTAPEIETRGDKNIDGSMDNIDADGDVTGSKYKEI